MTKRQRQLAAVAAALFIGGFGCGMIDEMDVEGIATTSAEMSEATANLADHTPGEASNNLRIVSIITDTISGLAFSYLAWRLRQAEKKEE